MQICNRQIFIEFGKQTVGMSMDIDLAPLLSCWYSYMSYKTEFTHYLLRDNKKKRLSKFLFLVSDMIISHHSISHILISAYVYISCD